MNWTNVLDNAALPEGQGMLMNNVHTESIALLRLRWSPVGC
jgi:hypothetical protein